MFWISSILPIEAMQDRRVVVVTNMKTRKLRGEPSMGMILAAEKDINEKLKVEPIIPPKAPLLVKGYILVVLIHLSLQS